MSSAKELGNTIWPGANTYIHTYIYRNWQRLCMWLTECQKHSPLSAGSAAPHLPLTYFYAKQNQYLEDIAIYACETLSQYPTERLLTFDLFGAQLWLFKAIMYIYYILCIYIIYYWKLYVCRIAKNLYIIYISYWKLDIFHLTNMSLYCEITRRVAF